MKNNEYKCTICLYNSMGEMLEFDLPNQLMNLENFTFTSSCTSKDGDESMTYKIKRKITVEGKPRWITASTEQEYAEKIIQLFGYSQDEGEEKHIFGEYANNWFEIYSKPNISEVTAITYERQLKKYLLPSFGEKYIEDITTDDIQGMFNNIKSRKASKEKIKTVLNQIFKSAIDDRYIERNPLSSNKLKITGEESQTTPPYTVEQMRYIEKHIGDVKKEQDRAFIALQALHPMRLEEVLGLKWSDIDFDRNTIHIQRAATHPTRNMPEIKETKTESSNRIIYLSTMALKYLKPTRKDEFILGGLNPHTYTETRRMCERIRSDIGFDEKITSSRFRTTSLTDLYNETKDIKLVQEAAGHTTAAMTLEYYVKGRSDMAQAASAIENLYGN